MPLNPATIMAGLELGKLAMKLFSDFRNKQKKVAGTDPDQLKDDMNRKLAELEEVITQMDVRLKQNSETINELTWRNKRLTTLLIILGVLYVVTFLIVFLVE